MTRRFYMGTIGIHNHVRENDCFIKLYDEAVREAKEYLEENPDCEERAIVEIVAFVRRERTPIIVEKVRR